jgi:hypothetical protein
MLQDIHAAAAATAARSGYIKGEYKLFLPLLSLRLRLLQLWLLQLWLLLQSNQRVQILTHETYVLVIIPNIAIVLVD